MFKKSSRYQKTVSIIVTEKDKTIFRGTRSRKISKATGVLEHVVKEGDRLDLLAEQYYNDAGKWWRILDANQEILYPGVLSMNEYVGNTILIPRLTEPE